MAKVTSKGQITIPVSIRRRLGVNEGDKLLFIEKPGGVMMVNPNMPQEEQADELIAAPSVTDDDLDTPVVSDTVKSDENKQPVPPPPANVSNPRSDEFDVAALLNEIRSIGSKI